MRRNKVFAFAKNLRVVCGAILGPDDGSSMCQHCLEVGFSYIDPRLAPLVSVCSYNIFQTSIIHHTLALYYNLRLLSVSLQLSTTTSTRS